jgi:ATP-dependent metalloprotease
VGLYTDGAPDLHKATIIPRGPAGGLTMFLPDDRTMVSRKQLLAQLDMMMGGRVAELLVYGEDETTTGAINDLQQATALATRMVTQYGFSDKVGQRFVSVEDQAHMSDADRTVVDQETRALLQGAFGRARDILTRRRKELGLLASALVERETLTVEEIKDAVGYTA